VDDNYKHFVGVDWATVEHEVCAMDAGGRHVGARSFKHSGDGLALPAEPRRHAPARSLPQKTFAFT